MNVCNICELAQAKYTCPKCNQSYCTLDCYRSETHLECSEHFYKECIEQQLATETVSTADAQNKMQEILFRLHKTENDENDDSELDSDDENLEDLGTRLAGIDLDDSEAVWKHLNDAERLDFEAFLRSDDVSQYVARWTPWWDGKCAQDQIPQVWETIHSLKSISSKSPAACVENNLINILATYVFLARYFNGAHAEFVVEFAVFAHNLCVCLRDAVNFDSPRMAIESVRKQCVDNRDLDIAVDRENMDLLEIDVNAILATKDNVVAALSDLRRLLEAAKKASKEGNGEFSTKFTAKCVNAVTGKHLTASIRKVEYFLSFANDVYRIVRL